MTTNNDSLTDASARFSLLEMDGPVRAPTPIALPERRLTDAEVAEVKRAAVTVPGVAQAATVASAVTVEEVAAMATEIQEVRRTMSDGTCGCGAARPLAIRGRCPRCQGTVPRPAPLAQSATPAPADFATAAEEGQVMAAGANLVRGGVRREDVNPVAGYNVPVIAARGQATRYALSQDDRAAAVAEGAETRGALRDGQLVAGAIAEGHGVLVSWSGRGELSLGQIRELVAAAGAPDSWCPKARSAHGQAGHAVDTLNGRGYVVRATRAAKGEAMETRGWRARWTVGVVAHQGGVGETLGRRVLQVTLTAKDELEIEGDAELAQAVREEYRRRTSAEAFGSAEVTDWLRARLLGSLGGVKLGGAYYIPRASVDAAVALCTEVAKVWGAEWMLPALPIATSAQLRTSLANGLATEAQDVLDELAVARAAATKDGKQEIGGRAAATLLAKLVKVQDRCAAYAALLGEAETARVRAAVTAAVETVRPLVSDTTQRGNLIWDEVAGAR